MYEIEFRPMHERHCVEGRTAIVLDPELGDFPVAAEYTADGWLVLDPEMHMIITPTYIAPYKLPAGFESPHAGANGELARYYQ